MPAKTSSGIFLNLHRLHNFEVEHFSCVTCPSAKHVDGMKYTRIYLMLLSLYKKIKTSCNFKLYISQYYMLL
jgi:hypothetical protein